MIFEFFEIYFYLGAWAMPDVLPCRPLPRSAPTRSVASGDPVVGIYVAGVAGGLGFLHSNFQ